MKDYSTLEYNRMPARLLQTEQEVREINYSDYYVIDWDRPNRDFGSFRVDPLKNTVVQNKRGVISALRNAYNWADNSSKISIASFEEAKAFAKQVGVHIIHKQYGPGKSNITWIV